MDAKADRCIFHCDCNNFFASCECLERPELKEVPMAVAGDPETRAGIVFAKNELAKKCGVRTTDTVWKARQKCPHIVFVPPRHRLYEEISGRVNGIYRQYTDLLEPASIDESYLDLTGTERYYGLDARQLADLLRARVRTEIGITISVGVSFNKMFAKMASDYKKPDATTVITRGNFRQILWPLPIGDMLYVGASAGAALANHGVATVGALAACDPAVLRQWLGKGGEQLWRNANGLDDEPVRLITDQPEAKSVSRGRTFKRDLVSEAEVHTGLAVLTDEIAANLRHIDRKGAVVQLQIKTPSLRTISRQITLDHYTYLQKELLEIAMGLFRAHWRIGPSNPVRALTVAVTQLVPSAKATEQLSLFDVLREAEKQRTERQTRERQEKLEAAIEALRARYGLGVISHGIIENAEIGIEREGGER